MGRKRIFATRTLPEPIPLTFEDELGQRVTEKFTVRYRSFSPSFAREVRDLEDGNEASLAKSLGRVVVALIDDKGLPITGEDGEPAKLGEAFFDSMNAPDNLRDLYRQIAADVGGFIQARTEGAAVSEPLPNSSKATDNEEPESLN